MNWFKIYEYDNLEKILLYKKCMLYKVEFSIYKYSKINIIFVLINKNVDGKMNVFIFFKNLVFFLIIYFILWIKFLFIIMFSLLRLKMKFKLFLVIILLGGFIYFFINMFLKKKIKIIRMFIVDVIIIFVNWLIFKLRVLMI